MDVNGRAEFARSQLRYEADRKSTGVAYLLLIFLGGLGAHRFYLGHTGTAVAQLLLSVFGWITVGIGIGALMLVAVLFWLFADLYLTAVMVRGHNVRLVGGLARDAFRF